MMFGDDRQVPFFAAPLGYICQISISLMIPLVFQDNIKHAFSCL